MAEKLRYIDEEYLSKYDALAVDSTLATEPAFAEMLHVEREYSIMESESEQDNTYLAYNVSLGELPDPKFCNGFAALADVLCSMPGAPVKQALLDAGIGTDLSCLYDTGVKQPYFFVIRWPP